MQKLAVILLFTSCCVFSQSKTDSIIQRLPEMMEDSLKVKAYFDLFWDNYRKDNTVALKFASEAEELSRKLGLTFQLADAHRVKSFSLSHNGELDAAKKELDQSLKLFTSLEDKKMVASVITEFGWLSKAASNYEKALSYFLEALKISREVGDKDNSARTLNYLAGIYNEQKQYDKAITHYKEALALVEQLGIQRGISACLTNLASVYSKMGNFMGALDFHQKALHLKKEMGDKLGEARVLSNMGILNNELGEFSKAEDHFMEARRIAQKTNDTKLDGILTYGLAASALGKKEFDRAISLTDQLLKTPELDLELQVKSWKLLFRAYGNNKNFEKAYQSSIQWQVLSDSLYNSNMLAVTNELEAKYQNEQKTKEIALLASEKEVQELQLNKRENERNAIIVFAILVLFLAGLLYNQYHIKQKSNKELQVLNEVKSNFFANISHEFRTPLTLIKGPIEHLEQNPDEQLHPEDVTMIRRNANKVLGLVNQLLDLSRIDQGKLQLKPTEGDVYKCLRAAGASFNSHAAQRNMDYIVEIPNGMLWSAFDRTKLEKIVYNLLSNAFKFSENGEEVAFEANYIEGKLEIKVSDSGEGISEGKLPFIFDRFYQADSASAKDREGSGIGLSLSKDLVELMDGTITVSSEEGKGTFFTVQIPMEKIRTRQKSIPEGVLENKEQRTKAHTFELQKSDLRNIPQILLVEDNEDMRHFIKSQLVDEYRIIEAKNGQEGLQKALVEAPDLILSDLMMPKMDGIELCKNLKTHFETSHIPIIMLTARAGSENKIEGLETGADDYLTKPFDAAELSVRVKNLIQRQQLLREYIRKNQFVFDASQIKTTSLDKRFLEQLLELMEKEHSNPSFGVPKMQKAMALSKTQLHRKVKALTNESPGELLRNFRLKRAALLLSKKTDTVTQVAYQVGFNNLSYFAKCFKELHGVSPSSY